MKLSEVKEVFTHITKLPGKKVFALAVVEGVGERRMISTIDWLWAIDHIRAEFRVEERETKLQETQTPQVEKPEPKDDYEAVANSLQEMPLNIVELFLTSLFSQIEDKKILYRELAKHLHPDTSKVKTSKLFLILKDIYDLSNQQQQESESSANNLANDLVSDEEIGKNASEIPF